MDGNIRGRASLSQEDGRQLRWSRRPLFVLKSAMSIAGVAALVVSQGSAVASASSRHASKSPVTFVLSTPFTGPNAFIGKIFYAPAKVACNLINQAGGILGHDCKLVTVDSRSDPADAVINMRQALASNSNIAVAEGLGSSTGPAVIPILAKDHIVALGGAGESSFVRPESTLQANAKYLYMLQPPDAMQGFAMGLAAKQLKVLHPALVFADTPTTAPVLSGVEQSLKSLNIKAAIDLRIATDQASYGTEVAKLVSAHPDGIIFEADPQSSGTFFQNLKTQLGNIKLPMISDLNAVNASWYKAVKAALPASTLHQYLWIVSPQASPISGPGAKPLAAVWGKYNTGVSFSATAAFAEPLYDGFTLAALAMTKAKSTNPSVFDPYLYKLAAQPGNMKGKVAVYTYAQGVKALQEGKNIAYWGAYGPLGWTNHHVRVPDFVAQHFVLASSGPSTSSNGLTVKGSLIAKILHL